MAQTKTRRESANSSSTRSGSSGSRAAPRSRSRPNPSSRRRTSGATSRSANEGGVAPTVSSTASKVKTPVIAGGAALAGLAGGIAVARNGRRKKVLGVPVPRVGPPNRATKKALDNAAKAFGGAASELGKTGSRVAELTSEVRRIRESVDR